MGLFEVAIGLTQLVINVVVELQKLRLALKGTYLQPIHMILLTLLKYEQIRPEAFEKQNVRVTTLLCNYYLTTEQLITRMNLISYI
jgi:hypothetical protein